MASVRDFDSAYQEPRYRLEPTRPSVVVPQNTHSLAVGYGVWVFGFFGVHRFYYGKPLTGILWAFTLGLYFVGWIVDFFLIPDMDRRADRRYLPGRIDYSIAWILLVVPFLGPFGAHRFYMQKWVTAIIWFLTAGLFGIGWIYDLCTLNGQISEENAQVRGW